MHSDLTPKGPRRKSLYQAEKHSIAADAPPGKAAKQAFYYGLAGVLSLPLVILLAFVDEITAVLWALFGFVWLIAVVCLAAGVYRGKYELDAVKRGRSAPRGRTPALVGAIAGVVGILANIVVIIIAVWPAGSGIETFGGPFGSPEATFKTYIKALENDDFDTFLKCLASSKRFDTDTNDDGVPDSTSERFQEKLRESFKKLRERWGRFDTEVVARSGIESDGDYVTLDVSRKNKATGEDEGNVELRMKKEADGWKIFRDPHG
ncbi:MAG: hypothetical protein ABIH04_07640 [Planctomycetota bacterium]